MTSFYRRLLQRLAFSESGHFSWEIDPANTMVRRLTATRWKHCLITTLSPPVHTTGHASYQPSRTGHTNVEESFSIRNRGAPKVLPRCQLVSTHHPMQHHPQHALPMLPKSPPFGHEALKGTFSFDATPMAPLGTEVLVHMNMKPH